MACCGAFFYPVECRVVPVTRGSQFECRHAARTAPARSSGLTSGTDPASLRALTADVSPQHETRPPLYLEKTRAPVAQLDRASDYGSEGWEFESLRARHDACRLDDAGVGGAWRSPVSAPGSGPGGRWFKSTRPDHHQEEPRAPFVLFARVAQLDRASASGAEGRGFESRLARMSMREMPRDRSGDHAASCNLTFRARGDRADVAAHGLPHNEPKSPRRGLGTSPSAIRLRCTPAHETMTAAPHARPSRSTANPQPCLHVASLGSG